MTVFYAVPPVFLVGRKVTSSSNDCEIPQVTIDMSFMLIRAAHSDPSPLWTVIYGAGYSDVHVSSFYEDSSHAGLGPTIMTLSLTDTSAVTLFQIRSVPIQSYSWCLGSSLACEFEGTQSL